MRVVPVIISLCAIATPLTAADPLSNDVLFKRLIAGLQDHDPDVRQNLAIALAKIGPAAVEPLSVALSDDLPERRAGAAYALGQIGEPARPALPKLLDTLDDKDLDVRRQASYAISRLVTTSPNKPPTAPTVGGK